MVLPVEVESHGSVIEGADMVKPLEEPPDEPGMGVGGGGPFSVSGC